MSNSHSCPRPASPFFRHRPLGRAPSPPTWACYEQIPARSDLLGSSDSDSDSGDAADEDSLSDADSSSSDDDAEADAEAEAAGLMDVESDKDDDAVTSSARRPDDPDSGASDPEKRDKGKQRAEDPPNSTNKSVPPAPPHVRSRRPRGRRPPVSVLRPILTIQRSQGFVWNQDLFVPPYIKDRYVASTSPPTSTGAFSACASTSTSLGGEFEIEVVEIRVRDGELDDIIP
ncbi:hypothetical protein F5148DRAFT_1151256 [Russula earlei]|uniref:Uncharacterized protein n=1 Tax=Russula earlei TaxID=71964 RepID=A0ACC0U2M8_9AGAM|nr:hypothetical protein F5148DRAFT_1151256 [Russula earlei]